MTYNNTIRTIQKYSKGEWVNTKMRLLRGGDRFRMFEPDGTLVTCSSDNFTTEWVAMGSPFITEEGKWGILVR